MILSRSKTLLQLHNSNDIALVLLRYGSRDWIRTIQGVSEEKKFRIA